tara:strand:+ start:144 stop:275 length:132 start_codon:yes stop_codon:yes gene_type:complete
VKKKKKIRARRWLGTKIILTMRWSGFGCKGMISIQCSEVIMAK